VKCDERQFCQRASSKAWRYWRRSFTPNSSLLGMKVEAGYVTQQSQEPTNRAVALNQPEATEHTCLMAVPNSMRAVQLRAYGVSRKAQTYVMV
jgi:hypothetical protein